MSLPKSNAKEGERSGEPSREWTRREALDGGERTVWVEGDRPMLERDEKADQDSLRRV